MNSFYSLNELKELGLKSFGENVLISRNACIYGAENITIGNNVRIDDFCILSGKINIGSWIHISAYTGLFGGKEGIELADFVTISSRCVVYAISDDYSGKTMTNPMINDEYRQTYGGTVFFEKHSIIGSGCIVLPDVTLHEGVAVGAMSLVKSDLEEWSMYVGVPAVKIKERDRTAKELEHKMMEKNREI